MSLIRKYLKGQPVTEAPPLLNGQRLGRPSPSRRREAHLSSIDYADLIGDFAALCTAEYQIVELTERVTDRARRLLESHPLRAGDAVQLASALIVSDALQTVRLPQPIFLAADDRLLAAARAEGMVTDDPRAHP